MRLEEEMKQMESKDAQIENTILPFDWAALHSNLDL